MLAAFGRAISEVGAIIIVGGNIAGVTRTMTTTIVLETSKGNLPLALALGLVLIILSVALNGVAFAIADRREVHDDVVFCSALLIALCIRAFRRPTHGPRRGQIHHARLDHLGRQ